MLDKIFIREHPLSTYAKFSGFLPDSYGGGSEKWGQWSRREGTFLEWHIRVHKFNIMFVMLLDLTRSQSHHRQQGLRLLSRVSNFSVRNVPHWSTFTKPPIVFTNKLRWKWFWPNARSRNKWKGRRQYPAASLAFCRPIKQARRTCKLTFWHLQNLRHRQCCHIFVGVVVKMTGYFADRPL